MTTSGYAQGRNTHSMTLCRLVGICLAAVIALLPFYNNFPFNWGHFSRSLSFYPVLALLLIFPFSGMRFQGINKRELPLLSIHVYIWISVISFVVNIFYEPLYQAESVKNIFKFGLFYGVYLVTLNAAKNNIVNSRLVEKAVVIAIVIVLPYCLFEILAYFSGFSVFSSVLGSIEPYFHDLKVLSYNQDIRVLHRPRVRGFAMEPSYFACVVAFCYPFILAKVIKNKNLTGRLLLAGLLLSIYFSFSRSVYLVVLIQSCCFLVLSTQGAQRSVLMNISIFFIVLAALFLMGGGDVLLTLGVFNETSYSNTMRLESVIAALKAAFDNPFLGLGFVSIEEFQNYYRDSVYTVAVAQFWLQEREGGAAIFSAVLRVFAEGGLIAGAAYFTFWFYIIRKNYQLFLASNSDKSLSDQSMYTMSILLALIGIFVSLFAIDTQTFWGVWVILGLAVANITKNGKIPYKLYV